MTATSNQQPATFIHRNHHAIITWLSACALLVAMMVIIGGYTRLSGSGLSITEWKPIHGTIPPLNSGEWQEEFTAYQHSPQYKQVNTGMTLSEFKSIFWPEYIHRLLGRAIGIVFLLPFIIFVVRGNVERGMAWRLLGIFALGGLQGLIGWLMVKSGLVDTPQVSPLRLALHLSTALAILGLLVWTVMDIVVISRQPTVASKNNTGDWRLKTFCLWFIGLCAQIILGALMAGTHAGLVYNTWPSMNGQILPETWDKLALIQFLHRNMAVLVTIGFILWWYCHREYVKNARLGKLCAAIMAIIAIQFTLGVLTLINAVPLPLALAHQAGGLALFATSVVLLHKVDFCRISFHSVILKERSA